jgi:serine protease AprX
MFRRSLLSVSLCLLTVSLFVASALAVEIDQDLREQYVAKSDREMVPVLMVFDKANRVPPSVLSALDGASPSVRRAAVLDALKDQAQLQHVGAASVLQDSKRQSDVQNVHYLYLANAIAFDATWDLVTALAALPDAATLLHDKTYDLTAATEAGVRTASAPKGIAATDTVWSVKYINADRVWNELGYTGAGVIVGHIDTGVWVTHPDLASRLWVNPGEIANNGIDDDGNGFIDDINGWDFGVGDNNPNDDSPTGGHGTHTAGSVAGDGTNGTLTGVAPEASIMALKVWDAAGNGGSLGVTWAAEQYAVENGARIITMSLGFPGTIPESFLRAERSNCSNIRDAGVTFFNSAGNDHFSAAPPEELGLTARVPAPWNELAVPHSSTGGVISVGGTGYQNDALYSSSSRGPADWEAVSPWNDWPYNPEPGLIKPDVGAPGVGINSTIIGGGYSGDTWNGTSMACPHAAGVAALMLQKNPSLSPAGIDSLMELNAIDLGTVGKDNSFGAGRLDAYDVVTAVPTDQNPDLAWVAVVPDPTGDAVLDPGEISQIAIELKNASPLVTATGVTANVAVVANPYVTVVDGAGTFANIATNGGLADNTANSFSVNVAAGAPQGFGFTMLVTVFANGTFEQTFDIPWYVGLPDWRTHDQGGMYLTVTDQGIIGYMSQSQAEGDGMGFQDGGSGLFVGSFWAGTGVDYVCNRDYSGLGTETYEWEVSDTSPNGRVHDLGATKSDQTFTAVFTDAGHASPQPLQVEQTTMAFGLPGNDQFVILEYRLTNQGPTNLDNLRNAVFCDFDVGDSGANLGGTDATRNLTYVYASGGTYVGIALLGAPGSAQNLTLINNPTYVYPNSAVDDGIKMRHMSGVISLPTASTPDDWSALTSSAVALAADGGSAIVTYALVIGGSLTEIQAAVDAANAAYDPLAPVTPETPIKLVRLAQNTPNPFNPVTEIKFTVPRDGHVDLAVYDLSGRRIRTLISETVAAGERTALWDGRNDAGQQAPSGMYFYKYITDGQALSKKMTLVK